MRILVLALIRRIDRTNRAVGEHVRWLVLVIPLLTVAYAAVRRVSDWGHNGLTEAQWFMFAWLYMLGGGYTLLRGEHTAVDVLSAHWSARTRCLVDAALLMLLVLPACGYMAWHFWHFWLASFGAPDGPEDVLVGLQRWPLKLAMFLGFALLGLQCLAELLRRVAVVAGWLPPQALAAGRGAGMVGGARP